MSCGLKIIGGIIFIFFILISSGKTTWEANKERENFKEQLNNISSYRIISCRSYSDKINTKVSNILDYKYGDLYNTGSIIGIIKIKNEVVIDHDGKKESKLFTKIFNYHQCEFIK